MSRPAQAPLNCLMLYDQIASSKWCCCPMLPLLCLRLGFWPKRSADLETNTQPPSLTTSLAGHKQEPESVVLRRFWLSHTDNVNLPGYVQVVCGVCKLLHLTYVFQCCKIPLFETEPKDY